MGALRASSPRSRSHRRRATRHPRAFFGRLRRRPLLRRSKALRSDRPAGRKTPHRPLAQRSGRDRFEVVVEARVRRGRRADRRSRNGAEDARRRRSSHADARLHALEAGGADHLRALVPRLRRDAGARPLPFARRREPRRRVPARLRRPRRDAAADRPPRPREIARLRAGDAQLPRRRLRPRLRRGVPLRRGAAAVAPLAHGRGPHLLQQRRGGVRRVARCHGHRLVAHAAEEKPRRPRADARPRRARDRRADRTARPAQRSAARVRQGPPARQRAALPHPRRPRHRRAGADRDRVGPRARPRAHARRGGEPAAHRHRRRRRHGGEGDAVPRGARDRRAAARVDRRAGEGARHHARVDP